MTPKPGLREAGGLGGVAQLQTGDLVVVVDLWDAQGARQNSKNPYSPSSGGAAGLWCRQMGDCRLAGIVLSLPTSWDPHAMIGRDSVVENILLRPA